MTQTSKVMRERSEAELDRDIMIKEGKATLYLSKNADGNYEVTNWMGTLKFIPLPPGVKGYFHNIAQTVYYVWFHGPDGFVWWGKNVGDNTQICHCRRTKRKVK